MQLALGTEAAGATAEVREDSRRRQRWPRTKPGEADSASRSPPSLGSAFLMGPTFRPKLPALARQEARTPAPTPAQHSDLASASYLGLAVSLGNQAEAGPIRLPFPSLQLCVREGASLGYRSQLRACVHVDTRVLCT